MRPAPRIAGLRGLFSRASPTGSRSGATSDAAINQCLVERRRSVTATKGNDISSRPAATRQTRLQTALRDGYGVQYWGENYTAEELSSAPHGLLILEAARIGAGYWPGGKEVMFSHEEVRKISHNGERPVLAYLNLAEIESYRDYWVAHQDTKDLRSPPLHPSWIGPTTSRGERLAQYWTPDWQSRLFERVDRLMANGFDGLFLDDGLHYYTYATDTKLDWSDASQSPDAPGKAREFAYCMMELITRLAKRTRWRTPGAFIVVNNCAFIGRDAGCSEPAGPASVAMQAYTNAIDGIMIENFSNTAALPSTILAVEEDIASADVSVLALGFSEQTQPSVLAKDRSRFYTQVSPYGYTPYFADNSLFDRLYPTSCNYAPTKPDRGLAKASDEQELH